MKLTLAIENETRLPDGGPLSIAVTGTRGIDIGRDQHLDWSLPDPSRTISSRHCEVRFKDGAYWLHDISVNGTYLNGASHRVQSPYRLRDGDRLEIGHYLIAVRVEGEPVAAPEDYAAAPVQPTRPAEFWGDTGEEAPPISRRELMPARDLKPVRADFIDWAVDIPEPQRGFNPDGGLGAPTPRGASAPSAGEDLAWAPHRPPPPAPVAAPTPIPTPQRPGAAAPGADPWGEGQSAAAQRRPLPGEAGPPPPPTNAWGGDDEPLPPLSQPAPRAPVTEPPASSPFEASPAPPMPTPARPAGFDAPAPMAPRPSLGDADFLRRFARGAGIAEDVVSWQDAGALAEQLGLLVRTVSEEMKLLLSARAETKRIVRSTNQTMIQAVDNNPLKFSPTVEDALRLMLGKPTKGYLDARRALDESFKDLKAHQVKTYSAMQHALRMLVEDLDPEAVAESVETDRGISGLMSSRKAKMWDAYVARWEAKTAPYEDGLVDAFMIYFSECYDRGGKSGS